MHTLFLNTLFVLFQAIAVTLESFSIDNVIGDGAEMEKGEGGRRSAVDAVKLAAFNMLVDERLRRRK